MRLLIIALAIVGIVFLAVMLGAPGGRPSPADNERKKQEIASSGPPGFVTLLGDAFATFAPRAELEPANGRCPGPANALIGAATQKYRILKARLAPGSQAATLVFTPVDPREDGESGPYVLKLDGAKPKGSIPVGKGGGCLAWSVPGADAPPLFD